MGQIGVGVAVESEDSLVVTGQQTGQYASNGGFAHTAFSG
jgi:hypothetical protein